MPGSAYFEANFSTFPIDHFFENGVLTNISEDGGSQEGRQRAAQAGSWTPGWGRPLPLGRAAGTSQGGRRPRVSVCPELVAFMESRGSLTGREVGFLPLSFDCYPVSFFSCFAASQCHFLALWNGEAGICLTLMYLVLGTA